MSDVYDAYVDRAVHRRIALGRYSNHVVRQTVGLLGRMEVDLANRVKVVESDSYTGMRLERLLDDVRFRLHEAYAVLDRQITGDLDGLAGAQIEWEAVSTRQTGARIDITTDLPTVSQVVAAVKARPFQTKLLSEWLSDLETHAAARVRGTIRQGFVEGASPAEIARRLRGTRARRYQDGIMSISRRGAETMVRTAITHTAAVASEETYRAFGSVVIGVRWVSVLDARTSLTCISLNGRLFPVGKGIRPPAHLGCRSTVCAELADVQSTPIPSYSDWLERQTRAQQDDILGPARAVLWRGGAPLEAFTDNRGRVLTLAQLRAA